MAGGKRHPENYKRTMCFTLPQNNWLIQASHDLGLSVSELLRRLVDQYRQAQGAPSLDGIPDAVQTPVIRERWLDPMIAGLKQAGVADWVLVNAVTGLLKDLECKRHK